MTNNIEFRKVGDDLYQLGDRLFRGSDPIALHPTVDKAAREFTDDIMRTLDVSFAEYAETAHIDRARFRNWWAGEPGAQLTAHDVYEIDQLNGEFIQGKIRQHREEQESAEQVRQQAAAHQQQRNAELQSRSDASQMWSHIIQNAPPEPKKPLDWHTQKVLEYLESHPDEPKLREDGPSSTV